jgi:hypothetical protein
LLQPARACVCLEAAAGGQHSRIEWEDAIARLDETRKKAKRGPCAENSSVFARVRQLVERGAANAFRVRASRQSLVPSKTQILEREALKRERWVNLFPISIWEISSRFDSLGRSFDRWVNKSRWTERARTRLETICSIEIAKRRPGLVAFSRTERGTASSLPRCVVAVPRASPNAFGWAWLAGRVLDLRHVDAKGGPAWLVGLAPSPAPLLVGH